MSRIAIYPKKLRDGTPFGFSFGWFIKDKKGEYILSFGNCSTREKVHEILAREKPDVELIDLDYTPPNIDNPKQWRTDKNDKGEEYFIHFPCGLKSYHPDDIKNKYCAACHTFPEDEANRAKLEARHAE